MRRKRVKGRIGTAKERNEERRQEDESHSPAGYWKYLRAVEHGAI